MRMVKSFVLIYGSVVLLAAFIVFGATVACDGVLTETKVDGPRFETSELFACAPTATTVTQCRIPVSPDSLQTFVPYVLIVTFRGGEFLTGFLSHEGAPLAASTWGPYPADDKIRLERILLIFDDEGSWAVLLKILDDRGNPAADMSAAFTVFGPPDQPAS